MRPHATRLWVLGPVCLLVAALLGLLISSAAQRRTAAEAPATSQNASSGNYILVTSSFSSGSGGTRLQSSSYQLDSSLGEPALNSQVTLSSPSYKLRPGFLASFNASSVSYLPLLRTPVDCSSLEPTSGEVYETPLAEDTTYEAMLCTLDDDDYYKFNASSAGNVKITITLPSALNGNVRFWLYKNDGNAGTSAATNGYTIDANVPAAGEYIIGVYSDSSFDANNAYMLRLSYP